jgi:hypothetical protein
VSEVDDMQEEDVENLVDLGLFLAFLGAFFVGIGVLYAVSIWDRNTKNLGD